MALAAMLLVSVVVFWPDIAAAQQEGAEVIRGGAEWVIGLFKQGAVVLLVLGIIGAISSLVAGNIPGAAISFFCIVVAAAFLFGADAAVARWFGSGSGIGIGI